MKLNHYKIKKNNPENYKKQWILKKGGKELTLPLTIKRAIEAQLYFERFYDRAELELIKITKNTHSQISAI